MVALLERDSVQVLGGDIEAATESLQRIEALKARRILLSDLLGVPEHEGGLDREQFLRQNAALKSELEAEEARLRAARPMTNSRSSLDRQRRKRGLERKWGASGRC